MKPCSANRKLIAWLAVDALDVPQASDLRAHLETCAGCRRYLEEISNAAERLIAAEAQPDIQATESFHQQVVRRLKAAEAGSYSEMAGARLRAMLLNWRVVLPVIGAAAVVIAAWSMFAPRQRVARPTPAQVQAAIAPKPKHELPPTLSNYQRVANRSLDELDELLTRQGNRNPPPTPFYTASTRTRANSSE